MKKHKLQELLMINEIHTVLKYRNINERLVNLNIYLKHSRFHTTQYMGHFEMIVNDRVYLRVVTADELRTKIEKRYNELNNVSTLESIQNLFDDIKF